VRTFKVRGKPIRTALKTLTTATFWKSPHPPPLGQKKGNAKISRSEMLPTSYSSKRPWPAGQYMSFVESFEVLF
jgi:hypothetical protein